MKTIKYHYKSSIGYITIEQEFEKIDPEKENVQFFISEGIDYNPDGNYVFRIWVGNMCEGKNTKLTLKSVEKRLKEIVIEETGTVKTPFLYFTGSSISNQLENPLKIIL